MKKIINYEKDILFKTAIGSITTISLEHDFTVDDNVLKGEFILTGEYKANELSINKEAFEYRLPLEYELEPTVDRDTLSYDIDNFEYNVKDDCLTVYIDFGVRYEERTITPNLPEITEEDLNSDPAEVEVDLPRLSDIINTPDEEPIIEDEPTKEENQRIKDEDKEIILNAQLDDDYMTYHVHIVRDGETLETIADKYKTTVETIKKYNSVETLELKNKLIIPACNE